MIYEWGSYRFAADPNEVGQELERIGKRNPDEVTMTKAALEQARDPESPLHAIPEWDDEVAAENYRLGQIRTAINSLVVVVHEDDDERQTAPAFYHVNYENEQGERVRGYQPWQTVASNVRARKSASAELLAHLRGLQRRHQALGDFQPVWQAVDQVAEQIDA